ncbi:hypothetical protein [Tropicibacter sp. S64]|uniref:hypothetical protein n=1 Tax=Tropicibacter sp. S64 TaxID=3415122 RepID=UPI003C7B830A
MIWLNSGSKVKTYSATSRSGRHVLKIEVEYPDAMSMAYDMEQIDKAKAEERPAPTSRKKAQPRGVEHQKPLMLPAPEED